MSTKHKQNIFPNTSSLFKNLESINTHSKYLEKGDVNNHKFPPPQHELTDKSNTPREAGLKAEQPIISRSHSKPVSCLRGRGEEAAAASALPDTGRPEKPRSYCCKAFVQNCGKTAEKVWVLNPLIAKSVGVKTPTSPTGATPLWPQEYRCPYRADRNRGLPVAVHSRPSSLMERVQRLTWRKTGKKRGAPARTHHLSYKDKLLAFRCSQTGDQ